MTVKEQTELLKENYDENETIALKIFDRGNILNYCSRNGIVLNNDDIEYILLEIENDIENNLGYFQMIIEENVKKYIEYP